MKRNYIVKPEDRLVICIITETDAWNDDVISKGMAKCSPEDTFDEQFGCRLAYARALKPLAKERKSQAADFVKHYTSRLAQATSDYTKASSQLDYCERVLAETAGQE